MTSFVNLTYTFFLTSVLGMVDCTRSKGPKAQGLGRAEVLGGRVKNPGALAYSVTSRPHGLGLLCKIYTGVRKAHAGGGLCGYAGSASTEIMNADVSTANHALFSDGLLSE